ncbi:MAG: hypothetical protein KDD48_00615 [Bdellovibrionales bacterium]|nr:hypothetical protein [Bdellovibrionales bacterium]
MTKKKTIKEQENIDTHAQMKESAGTLAWLTETAVRQVGLESYTEFLKTGIPRKSFDQYHKYILFSFLVWGGGFLYIQKPFVAGMVFFLMATFQVVLLLGVHYLAWLPQTISPVHFLMIVAGLLISLWWISIFLPFHLVPNKAKRKSYHLFLFFVISFLITTILYAQIIFLLKTKVVYGWQFEEEFLVVCGLWATSLGFIVTQIMAIGLNTIEQYFFQRPRHQDAFGSAFLGFWSGIATSFCIVCLAMGPASGKMLVILERIAAWFEIYRFEKIAASLGGFIHFWRQLT